MVVLNAKCYADVLHQRLNSESSYQVHSVFANGLNLSMDDGSLVFLGTEKSGLLPFSVILDEKDCRQLSDVEIGDPVHFRDQSFFVENRNSVYVIRLDRASAYDTKITDSRHGIDSIHIAGFLSGFDYSPLPTGFGQNIGKLLESDQYTSPGLLGPLLRSCTAETHQALRWLVGRGQGLTPSGDDFLAGLLAVHAASPFMDSETIGFLSDYISVKGRTTDISAMYLTAALEKHFNVSIIRFLQAIETNDISKARICVEELLKIGHSSGKDTLAGLICGLKILSEIESLEVLWASY